MKEIYLLAKLGEISQFTSFSSSVNIYLKRRLLDYTVQPGRIGKAVIGSVVRITIIIIISRNKV